MTHHAGCERAKRHRCQCSICGGALHGWPHGLSLAGASEAERQAERERIDAEWDATLPARRGRGASAPRKAAAIDSANIDVVDWLSEHPPEVVRVQSLGNLLSKKVVRELESAFGNGDPRKVRASLVGHFWCELLVAFAEGIEECIDTIERVPEYVKAAFVAPQRASSHISLADQLIALAVRTAWHHILDMTTLPVLKESVPRSCRILAILICPAPEDHAAVREHALKPLSHEALREVTKERLAEVFPEEWISDLRSTLLV